MKFTLYWFLVLLWIWNFVKKSIENVLNRFFLLIHENLHWTSHWMNCDVWKNPFNKCKTTSSGGYLLFLVLKWFCVRSSYRSNQPIWCTVCTPCWYVIGREFSALNVLTHIDFIFTVRIEVIEWKHPSRRYCGLHKKSKRDNNSSILSHTPYDSKRYDLKAEWSKSQNDTNCCP